MKPLKSIARQHVFTVLLALAVVGIGLSAPARTAPPEVRGSIESAAQMSDPCQSLTLASLVGDIEEEGFPSIEVPASLFLRATPGALICVSDMKASRIDALMVEFRGSNGGLVALLVPNPELNAEERQAYRSYLSEMYALPTSEQVDPSMFYVVDGTKADIIEGAAAVGADLWEEMAVRARAGRGD